MSAGNILLWTFTVLQWNCLGRAISIDPLALHNFRRGQSDSIAARYDSSKPDQEGEFVNEKNLYANPFKPVVCPVLALGIWLCIEQQRFIATERIFLGAEKDAKKGLAAHSYHEQLKKLITEHIDVVGQYVRKDRANGHGFRKGGAVHASSGTTFPASFTSVASRGEWSISKVLDQYFQWAATGDHQLGRSMCLLDPNHPNLTLLFCPLTGRMKPWVVKRSIGRWLCVLEIFWMLMENHPVIRERCYRYALPALYTILIGCFRLLPTTLGILSRASRSSTTLIFGFFESMRHS